MKKKVMILANNDTWVLKLRKEIITELIMNNYDVYISSPRGESFVTLENMGCTFIDTKLDRRGKNPFSDIRLFASYCMMLKKFKPDIVLSYTIKPNLYGSLACRLLKIPYINNITGLGSAFNEDSVLKKIIIFLYKVSLKNSYCVFFQNTDDKERLRHLKIVRDNFGLIPGSGVNLKEYNFVRFPENQNITFLFIGRIMKDKGIDQFLEAAKIIKNTNPTCRFKVIGFIEKTQIHYKELIENYIEQGIIEYLGFQTNIKPFIENSHCLIQPSHGGEGMSNVLLEAAATGRALICSNIAGCREVVENEKNGFLFEARSTESLVRKIEAFIELPLNKKIQQGEYSRKIVECKFDRKIIVNAYMEKIEKKFHGEIGEKSNERP